MELSGLTERQATIATILWNCDSMEQVDKVIDMFGQDAQVVRDLILMEALEEELNEQESFEHIADYLRDIGQPE
jgi:hypothetical protein